MPGASDARDATRLQVMSLIVDGAPLSSILKALVLGVESEHPGMSCSVLVLDSQGQRLHLGSAPSLPDFYNSAIEGVRIGDGVGSCGTAAYTGERVIAVDLQTDPRWTGYKELAARAGLGSCWSEPIFGGDRRVLGTFAIYHREPHCPDAADIETITNAAKFAAVAIERKQTEESLRWRTAFFEAQIESSLDGILIVDSNGRKIQQNRRLAELWKIPPEIVESLDDAAQVAFAATRARDPQAFVERIRYLYAHPEEVSRDEIELVDGTVLDRDTSPVYDKTGKFYGRIWRFRDITERKRSEEALRASEERWSFAIEGAGDGVWDWNLTTGTVEFSKRHRQMLGYDERDPTNTAEGWCKLIHPEDLTRVLADQRAYLEGRTANYVTEMRVRCFDGSWKWILSRGMVVRRGADQKPLRMVGTHSDISERKAMEEELRTAARIDRLTGLPNRALMMDRLQQAITQRKRFKEFHYAVLFMDFDRFKMVNDTLGHEAGDQLLREIARRLSATVRGVDSVSHDSVSHDSVSHDSGHNTASRLGGDEFVILLTNLRSDQDAGLVAERVLDAISAPYHLGDREIVSTASIGIVTSEFGHEFAEDVLRDADTAMYEAKNAGKGRAAKFDESMRTRVQRKADLESGIRRALDGGQFLLHYQPIVSLHTGKVASIEALIRWQHPQHGMISPCEFIPVAEETGLILPLGEWVLRQACRQTAVWQAQLGSSAVPPISVNLSRKQLALHNLPEKLREIAVETGIDPAAIHLEVTESAVMADAGHAVKTLTQIKQLGFRVYLDDFGTGYSSLSSLHQFPIDVLKIDRSFVANLARGSEFIALVGAIVMLAQNLKISVIAEGVETPEQVELLKKLGCQNAQGYFFSRPMPAGQLAGYLAAQSHAVAA
jgi:PAS domain S-box-containing protein